MSTSEFQKYLDQNPIEAKRLDEMANSLRLSAMPEIKAAKESDRITSRDLSITINALPDNS